MATTECTSVVDVCMLRVSQLTTGGAKVVGAKTGYITDNTISADIALTVKAGAVFDQVNGCGTVITHVEEPDTITGGTVKLIFSRYERELFFLLAGGTIFADGSGNTGGYQVQKIADGAPAPVCLELYSKAFAGSAVAVTPISTPNAAYHVFVLPYAVMTYQPFKLANGTIDFEVDGKLSENTGMHADGPFNDWPSWVAGKGGFTAVQGEYETATLPTSGCGRTAVPSGS